MSESININELIDKFHNLYSECFTDDELEIIVNVFLLYNDIINKRTIGFNLSVDSDNGFTH